MKKPAARVGDRTEHGGVPASGVGAVKTLIGGQPAWLTMRSVHNCPIPSTNKGPDGPEICIFGSVGVLIEGTMAVREGDKLVGLAPPNAFAAGCQDVLIGTLAAGMELAEVRDVFIAALGELFSNWDTLAGGGRLAAIEKLVDATLVKAKLDKLRVLRSFESMLCAHFSFRTGALEVADKIVESPAKVLDRRAICGALARELRRAEQLYALVDTWLKTSVVEIPAWVPPEWVERVKRLPLLANDPRTLLGQGLADSLRGPAKALRERVPAPQEPAGTGLPEEEDAMAVARSYVARFDELFPPESPQRVVTEWADL